MCGKDAEDGLRGTVGACMLVIVLPVQSGLACEFWRLFCFVLRVQCRLNCSVWPCVLILVLPTQSRLDCSVWPGVFVLVLPVQSGLDCSLFHICRRLLFALSCCGCLAYPVKFGLVIPLHSCLHRSLLPTLISSPLSRHLLSLLSLIRICLVSSTLRI